MRRAAETDDVADGKLDLGGRLLLDEGEAASELAPRHGGDVAPVQGDDAACDVA